MITLNEKELAELKKIFGNEDTCSVCGNTDFSYRPAYCKDCDSFDLIYPSYIFCLHKIMDVMLFHDKSYSEALGIVQKSYERSKYRGEK